MNEYTGYEYLCSAVCERAVEDYRKICKKILKTDLKEEWNGYIMKLHRIEKEMRNNLFWEYTSPDRSFEDVAEIIKKQEGIKYD